MIGQTVLLAEFTEQNDLIYYLYTSIMFCDHIDTQTRLCVVHELSHTTTHTSVCVLFSVTVYTHSGSPLINSVSLPS